MSIFDLFGSKTKINDKFLSAKGITKYEKKLVDYKETSYFATTGSGKFYQAILSGSTKVSIKAIILCR